MKDKEFDRLLSQSLKEYGHEYLHGADGPIETGPVPVHRFRDDFLSDIVTGKPEKKKNTSRYVRMISAVAAAFIVAMAAVIIAPQLTGSKNKVASPDVKMPWESSSAQNAAADRSGSSNTDANELGKPLNDKAQISKSSSQAVRESSLPIQSSKKTDTAYEAAPFEDSLNETPTKSPSQNEIHEAADPDSNTIQNSGEGFILPYRPICNEPVYHGNIVSRELTREELQSIADPLYPMISEGCLSNTDGSDSSEQLIFSITIGSAAGEHITINDFPIGSMSIFLYPSELIVRTDTDDTKTFFRTDSSSIVYKSFVSAIDDIFG